MKRKRIISIILVLVLLITVSEQFSIGVARAAETTSISYCSHVQTYGWEENWKTNGRISGTSGKKKRLEGIRIRVSGEDIGVRYTTHCQTYGWLPWVQNGEVSGTEGEAKRLEAIKIMLTGKNASKYDVYYRVHAQTYGWLSWAKNGQVAGTAGLAKRLEAIQIIIVPRGTTIQNNINGVKSAYPTNYISSNNVSDVNVNGQLSTNVTYRTHVQTYGWQGWKNNGVISGTSGQAKRLEGIKINLTNKQYSGDIVYRTHIQSYGWEKQYRKNGALSGTGGQAKRLEAIQICLTGEMAKHYDVYYRVHAQTYGWLDWVKNGNAAGTAGYAKRLEAIQIVLVKKGGKAPGNVLGIVSTQKLGFVNKPGLDMPENLDKETKKPSQGNSSDKEDTKKNPPLKTNEQKKKLLNTLPNQINLYYIEKYFEDSLKIPSNYPVQYQLNLQVFDEKPELSVQSTYSTESVMVSKDGLITLNDVHNDFWGDIWIEVNYEGVIKKINVKACSYSKVYVEQELNKKAEYFNKNYTDDLEKYKAITKHVACDYEYSGTEGTTASMIIHGRGNCIGSGELIRDISLKCGINARLRWANRDACALGGHMNTIAKINGDYYVAEAGYRYNRDKLWNVKLLSGGYLFDSYNTTQRVLLQYSGYETDIRVPEAVTNIGKPFDKNSLLAGYWGGVFYDCDVKTVTLPATVKYVSETAFTNAKTLENIYVDSANQYYTDIDGILYTKDKKTLIAMPTKHKKYVPKGTKVIAAQAFRDIGALKTTFVIPDGVTTIQDYAFLNLMGKIEIPESVTYISDYAFVGDDYIDQYMVTDVNRLTIIGKSGSYAEKYAKKNGFKFIKK